MRSPRPPAEAMIDSPEDHCGRHHVCRGIWGGVRHPLFFWLVWQHIVGYILRSFTVPFLTVLFDATFVTAVLALFFFTAAVLAVIVAYVLAVSGDVIRHCRKKVETSTLRQPSQLF